MKTEHCEESHVGANKPHELAENFAGQKLPLVQLEGYLYL